MKQNCAVHRSVPLSHFCQTCNDAVCEQCINRQPHSGQTHQVKSLQQSANLRRNHYVHFLNTEINPLRKRIQEKIAKLSTEAKHYEDTKTVIEKDIAIEYEAINNRLKEKVEKVIHHKQTQMKHYELFINKLDDLVQAYEKSFQHPQAFLLAYQTFDSELRKLQSLTTNHAERKIQPENQLQLQRQILQTYQKVDTLPQHEKNNQFMNQTICEFMKHLKKELKEEKEKVQKKAIEIQLKYNHTCSQLNQFKRARVCVFCGAPFTIDNVNEPCSNNRVFKIKPIYSHVNFDLIIPDECKGSKRHFWYESTSQHRSRPTLDTHSLIRKVAKKHYFNALSELQSLKYQIRHYEISEGKNLQTLFSEYDHQKTGFITKIAFTYIMNKILLIPETQIESLLCLLEEKNGIQYRKLRDLMEDPTQDYFKFVEQEEQMEKAKPVGPNSGSMYSKFKY